MDFSDFGYDEAVDRKLDEMDDPEIDDFETIFTNKIKLRLYDKQCKKTAINQNHNKKANYEHTK